MLRPVFSIIPEILRLIVELDEFKGQWRMIRSLSPEKLTSMSKGDSNQGWFLGLANERDSSTAC